MDRFVYLNNIVACTAHSSLIEGNWTTSGTQYNSLVVDHPYGNYEGSEKLKGTKLNSHGIRQKPDITAFAKNQASSYSTPMVCSGAALLLERAMIDNNLTYARQSIVIKSIIMAGATRHNYKISTDWGDGISQASMLAFPSGDWVRVSDSQPLSQHYGAGLFNIYAAYLILDAGEQNSRPVAKNRGWHYQDLMQQGSTIDYKFTILEPRQFSALMTWHREIDKEWNSFLADYRLSLFHIDNTETLVANSDNTTSNVELIETRVEPGNYRLSVTLKHNQGIQKPSFSLAWNHKTIMPSVDYFNKTIQNDCHLLSWGFDNIDSEDYKYRIQVSTDDKFNTIIENIYTDITQYCFLPNEDIGPFYFRLATYPLDKDVALAYPSEYFIL